LYFVASFLKQSWSSELASQQYQIK